MRTIILILVVSVTFWGWIPSLSAPPKEGSVAHTIKTGMQFDDAERSLRAVNATEAEYDEARGFWPRKPSDPPRPTVHLYMLDEKVRLEMFVDHDSRAIQTMVVRFEPEVRARIKANYFEALCYAVTFHEDNSYSLRMKKNSKAKNAVGATHDSSK